MSQNKSKGVLIAALIWIVIIGILGAATKIWVIPYFKGRTVEETGSDSIYKHTIRVRLDGFSGYAVLRSSAVANELKAQGIRLALNDDKADYVARMRALREGDADMAVFTVDALLSAGAAIGEFPATIALVIDETVGADAVVSWEDGLPSLEKLDSPEARIVATPNSPSEFLARTVVATLSLPRLPGDWLVSADGAEEVYNKWKTAGPRERKWAYVLWEPYVTRAKREGAKVLLDSSKMRGYIVDVLVARREFLKDHPDLVQAVVEAYLRAGYSYGSSESDMIALVREDAERAGSPLSEEDAKAVVSGIEWKSTMENYGLFGVERFAGVETLEDIIPKIARILAQTGAIKSDPVAGRAHTLYYRDLLAKLKAGNFHPGKRLAVLEGVVGPSVKDLEGPRTAGELPALSDGAWQKLVRVGAVRVPPIGFRRGTAELSEFSRAELEQLAARLGSWPSYYMKIAGHALAEGDQEANRALAGQRANAVLDYLVSRGVNTNRLRAEMAPSDKNNNKSEVEFVLGQMPY